MEHYKYVKTKSASIFLAIRAQIRRILVVCSVIALCIPWVKTAAAASLTLSRASRIAPIV